MKDLICYQNDRQKGVGKFILKFRYAFISSILLTFVVAIYNNCTKDDSDSEGIHGSATSSGSESSSTLPNITSFLDNKSDQFIVDLATVMDGHIYRGTNADNPHTGGHIYFDSAYFSSYESSGELNDLPKIYAPFDGVISKVDTYYAQSTGNYRYGYLVNFATRDGEAMNFNFSIEPFLNPSDSNFYKKFLLKSAGDTINKGEVIAYMYSSTSAVSANCTDGSSCAPSSQNAHIHFNLTWNGTMLSPSIFTDAIGKDLDEKMSLGSRHKDCSGSDCPADYESCAQSGKLGYQLSALENPFESSESTCL